MTNRLYYGDNLEILRNRVNYKQAERHVSTDGKAQQKLM